MKKEISSENRAINWCRKKGYSTKEINAAFFWATFYGYNFSVIVECIESLDDKSQVKQLRSIQGNKISLKSLVIGICNRIDAGKIKITDKEIIFEQGWNA